MRVAHPDIAALEDTLGRQQRQRSRGPLRASKCVIQPAPAESRAQQRQALQLQLDALRRRQQAGSEVVESLRQRLVTPLDLALQAAPNLLEPGDRLPPVGAHQRGRSGRRRRAHIGDLVGEQVVGLVADRAHHRDATGEDGARHALGVECPQVLDAAAATSDDEHVDLVAAVRRGDGLGDRVGRCIALHQRRVDDDVQPGHALAEDAQQVAHSGAGGRGDDADGAWHGWQRTLAGCVECALSEQHLAQRLERGKARPEPGQADAVDLQLELATRLIQGRRGAHVDLLAVGQHHLAAVGAAPEQNAAHRALRVLEREVLVAGCSAHQVADLAGDPQQREGALQSAPGDPVERAHADRRAGCGPDGHRCASREVSFHICHMFVNDPLKIFCIKLCNLLRP